MTALFQTVVLGVKSSKYALLFAGAFVEGPVVMMTSGFLWKLGQLEFFPMYVALVFGDFLADIGWYCFGRFATRGAVYKFGRFFGITAEAVERVGGWFQKYHQKILFISKLTIGFGLATIVLTAAGMYKISFRNYAVINLFGGFIWVIFLITIGYFAGNAFYLVPESGKVLFFIAMIAVFFMAVRFLNKYLKKVKI